MPIAWSIVIIGSVRNFLFHGTVGGSVLTKGVHIFKAPISSASNNVLAVLTGSSPACLWQKVNRKGKP